MKHLKYVEHGEHAEHASSGRTRRVRLEAFFGRRALTERSLRRGRLHLSLALSLLAFAAAVALWCGLEERVRPPAAPGGPPQRYLALFGSRVRGNESLWASAATLAPAVAPLSALAPLAVASRYRRAGGDPTARLTVLRLYGATLCAFVFVTGLNGPVFPAPAAPGQDAARVVADALALAAAPAIGCVLLAAAGAGVFRLTRRPPRAATFRRH